MARIELSAEVRAIESLIDAGEHGAASSRLQAAHTNLGRRPEYRYLVCLYDSTFHVRPDRDLLQEMIELVGDQPDLMEAAALLAQLYARLGDEARADLFAHLALESANPAARARAEGVLKGHVTDAEEPPSSRVKQVERPPPPSSSRGARSSTSAPMSSTPPSTRASIVVPPSRASSAPPPSVPPSRPSSSAPISEAPPSSSRPLAPHHPSVPPPKYQPLADMSDVPPESASSPTALGAWFEQARREVVHKRSATYGVRTGHSIVGMLLDWGKAVAEGNSFVATESMPLNRDALAKVDDAILSLRRLPGSRNASRSDTSRVMAAAGFFLAVLLHELEATVLEIAPDDGGCKVLLPSGAGTRPLLVAAAFSDGTGPSLVQTFDRLAAARELASGGPSTETSFRRAASIPAARPPSLTPVSSIALGNPRDELAMTRPEVEAATMRRLDRPMHPADPPPLNMAAVAGALMRSALSQDIAARSGAPLSPNPASIEALDSFCMATRGEGGAAPERSVWPTSDEDEEVILTWGALLGETLIAAYGGIWECDPNAPSDPRLFRVICEDRVAAWPMALVYLRLKNGARHSLVQFVAEVGNLLE